MKLRLSNTPVLILSALIAFHPILARADGTNYSNVLSQSTDSFIMSYGNTEMPNYYNCTVSTLSCANLGTVSPTLPTPVNTSAHFTFSTQSYWKGGVHTRYLYLRNNLTGRVSTRSYKLTFWDTLSDENSIYAFSPDQKTLVYKDDSSGYPVLYSLDLTKLSGRTFKGKAIFSPSISVSGFTLTSDNTLYIVSNKDAPYGWNLYTYDLATKNFSLIAENASYAMRLRTFDNGFTFFTITGSSSYPVFYNETTGQVQNFSGFTIDNSASTINSKPVSLNGLNGVLMIPANFNTTAPHQLVIWLHGGPYRQTSVGSQPYTGYAVYDLMLNQLAENGVAVLKLDYPGSYGYGAKFAEAIRGNVGKLDVADVKNALSVIKNNLNVSSAYLLGNSYGGYLALRTLVADPADFSGAMSINGVTDWTTLLHSLRNSIFNSYFNGLPNKNNRKLYAQASILSRISDLTDQKIILIQSQADKTVPPSQATLLYNALKSASKNVEFDPYPGEDHTFTKIQDLDGVCTNIFNALSLPLSGNCVFQ